MKKWPMIKRISALVLVLAMVATSAKFDWSAFTLKGKAWSEDATSSVCNGGAISQVVSLSSVTAGNLKQLSSLQIQLKKTEGQTRYASATIYKGVSSVYDISSQNAVSWGSGSISDQTEAYEIWTFSAPSGSEIYLGENETAVAVFTLTSDGAADDQIYYYRNADALYETGCEYAAGQGFSIGGNTICGVSGGTEIDATNAAYYNGDVSWGQDTIWVTKGDTVTVTPTLSPALSRSITITETDTSNVATVTPTNTTISSGDSLQIRGDAAGTMTLTATCGSATKTLTVKVLEVTQTATSSDYGTAVDLSTVFGVTGLTKGVDYTISPESLASNADAGTYPVTITGINNYAGFSWSGSYTINSVALPTASFATGTFMIDVTSGTVSSATVGSLVKDVDYEITSLSRTGSNGTVINYDITVVGKGNYYTTDPYTFSYAYSVSNSGEGTIDISDIAVIQDIESILYTGSEIKPTITLGDINHPDVALTGMSEGRDYEVVYEEDPTDCGTYEVTVNGLGKYVGSSISTEYVITQVPLTNDKVKFTTIDKQRHTGSEIKPALTITYKPNSSTSITLTEGQDFTVTYSNNTNVGTAKATVSGIGNYKGRVEKTFEIYKDLRDAEITIESKYKAFGEGDSGYNKKTYDGSAVTPVVNSVVLGGTPLTEYDDTTQIGDYSVDYADNTDASTTAKVRIIGKNTYAGQETFVYFTIKPRSIASSTIRINSITPSTVAYTGEDITPTAIDVQYKKSGTNWVSLTEYNETSQTGDYTITYENNKNVGSAKAIIVGTKNYTGTVEKTAFTITALDISNCEVVVNDGNPLYYTGSAQEPSVTVKTAAGVPISENDYTVSSYDNNTDVGTEAKVTVTGKNNLTGTKTQNFEIKAKTFIGSVRFTLGGKDYGTPTVTDPTATETEILYDASKDHLSVDYTGNQIYPSEKLYDGNVPLKLGTDYTKSVTNNIAAGESAKVILKGKGNYSGQTVTLNFKIARRNLGDGTTAASGIEAKPVKNSNGSVISPYFTVVDNNRVKTLTKDVDYTITWGDGSTDDGTNYNSTAGEKTAKVEAKKNASGQYSGNYEGGFEVKYSIGTSLADGTKVNLKYGFVGIDKNTHLFTGAQTETSTTAVAQADYDDGKDLFKIYYVGNARPKIELEANGGSTLTKGTNYTVSYSGGYNAGDQVTVTISEVSGNSDYYGEVKFTYTIEPFDVSKLSSDYKKGYFTTDEYVQSTGTDDYAYTGQEVEPYGQLKFSTAMSANALVKDDGTALSDADKIVTLTKGTDYTIAPTSVGPDSGNTDVNITLTNSNFTGDTLARKAKIKTGTVSSIQIGPSVAASDNIRAALEGTDSDGDGVYTYPTTKKELPYTESAVNPFEDGTWNLYFGGKKLNYYAAYTVKFYTAIDGDGKPTGTAETPVNAGTYYFDIELKDNFNNEHIYGCFAIKPQEVSTNTVTIKIDKDAFTYDKAAHQAGTDDFPVKVYYKGSNSAIPSSWYDLQVTNTVLGSDDYKLPGEYTISVQFKDGFNYDTSVTLTKTYKIVGNFDTALIEAEDVLDADGQLTDNIYEVYTDQEEFKTRFSTANIELNYGLGNSYLHNTIGYNEVKDYITIDTVNILKPGVASITVRGNGTYFKGSRTYQVYAQGDLKDAKISGWVDYTNSGGTKHTYAYTGNPVVPELTLTYNGEKLTRYTDYDEDFGTDHTSIGRHTAKFTGKRYYTGSLGSTTATEIPFYIMYDLSQTIVTVTPESFTYTGTEQKPTHENIKVMYPLANGTTTQLRVNLDYTVNDTVGTDYTSVGTKTLKLEEVTNQSYSSQLATYKIDAIDLRNCTIEFSTGSDSVYTGSQLTPAVEVKYGTRTLTPGTDYTLEGYKNNINAYTLGEGAEGFNASKAPSVTVKGTGNYKNSVTKYFTIQPKEFDTTSFTIELDETEVPYNGEYEAKPTYEVKEKLASGATRTLVKDKDYAEVASTSPAKHVGDTGFIKVKGTGNYSGNLGSNTTTNYDVVKAKLDSTLIDAPVSKAEYTGNEIHYEDILTITMACKDENGDVHDVPLTKGTDYTIAYKLNGTAATMTNAGTYTVELEGTGSNYEGSRTETFEITAKELVNGTGSAANDADDSEDDVFEITYQENQDYDNGNPIKPEPVIKDKSTDIPGGEYTLQKDVDYTLTWKNNTASASKDDPTAAPTIVITGMGNYKETVNATFNIGTDLTGASVVLTPDEYNYDGQEHKPTVSVTKGTQLTEGTDYTIEWPTDCTSAGTKTVTIKGTGAYYGTVTKDYEIHQKTPNLSKISVEPNLPKNSAGYYSTVYPGAAALQAMGGGVKPGVVVYDTEISESVPLVEGTDYTVAYSSNNNKAGSTTDPVVATVTLTGNYEGSYTKTTSFVIEPRSLSDEATKGSLKLDAAAVEWTGNQIKPVETVKDDCGNTLVQGTDYTITYGENKEVGDGTVTVTGKNNYAGTLEKTFVIYGNLTAASTSITIGNSFYTGDSSTTPTPKPTVVCAGKTLVQTELDASGNVVTQGQFRVTNVYSDDNFTTSGKVVIEAEDQTYYRNGPVTKTFDVVDDISLLKITGVANEYTYSGKAVKPQPVVKDAAGNEIPAASVVYTSNVDGTECINVGTVTMKVVIATTNTTEEKSITTTYKIVPRNINTCKISNLKNDTYTGSKLYPPVTVVWDGKELQSDNCTITYTNNVNPGVADVVIAGKNNFTGSRTLHFTIQAPRMQGVKAYGISDSQLVVMWTRANHVDGYEITYSVNGSTKKATTTSTSYTISGLSASTPYEVKVRTYVTVGGTKYYGLSTSTSGKTFVTTPDYLLTSPAAGMAQLSWSVASSGASGYSIYRSDSANGTFKRIADIPATSTTWTNRNLTSGKTYYYYIQAYQSDGTNITYGAKSVTRSITVK